MKYIQVQLGGCKREDLGVIKPKSPKWIIYFQHGKVATNASAFVGLEDAIKWYKENPGNDILIEGHSSSDEIDAVEANADGESIADVAQRISQLRAAAVRDYFVQRGVASSSVSSIGYGLSKPLPMHQEDFETSNRRAEILMRDHEDLRTH
ncbi:OmpA family protein [Pseudomonas sp. H1_D04]